jgi:hypothetical protein
MFLRMFHETGNRCVRAKTLLPLYYLSARTIIALPSAQEPDLRPPTSDNPRSVANSRGNVCDNTRIYSGSADMITESCGNVASSFL